MGLLLWLAAVILVIAGVIQLIQGQLIFGAVLVIVGLAIGPGGWSVTRSRTTHV